MEIRQLQYAVQLAEDRNFSRAAEKLHIAQPSLSQQIAKLEKELGVQLFRRDTSSVQLTNAGTIFVDKAQKVLDMLDQLQSEMDDIAQMRSGKLVIGSLPITGSHVLPHVLPVYRARYPNIDIVLIEDTSTNLEMLTAKGQADVSLLSLPLQEKSLTYQSVINERIRLAVPPQHQLAQQPSGTIDIKALAAEPFIILKRGQGFRQITIDLCERAGFTPNIVFESSNIETVQSLVATGMGVAFVPEMVSRATWSEFTPVYIDLADQPMRTLVVAYRQGRYVSKAAEAFIDILINEVRTYKQ